MSLARPVPEERAFGDLGRLRRRGRRLLVIAGVLALAFFFSIIVSTYLSGGGGGQNLILVIGDYVVTLGIAVPGLILYMLRLYTDKSIRKGNPKVFSNKVKLGLVSISWIVLLVILVLLIRQHYS